MPPPYQRLSPQDRTFLDLEGPSNPQHIGVVALLDAAPLRTEPGGIDIDGIRRYIASRLHLLPRYRQRLAWIPLEGHPVWVDDPHFNVVFHVRHTGLPRPGDERQLKRLAGRLLSQPLDRGRPLWEMWVVEGLEGGDRLALIQKVHHCMIDGVGGVDLMTLLMSPEPLEEIEPAPPYEPEPVPGAVELLRWELERRSRALLSAAASLPRRLRDPQTLLDRIHQGVVAVAETLGAGLRSTSDTPINGPLGPHRKFDWLPMDLARLKAVKNALGGTVNDVVLATVAGALRRFLRLRRVDVDHLHLRANIPVSLRSRDERGTLGNRIALLMADLPVEEADPTRRLARVQETMGRLKRSKQALGAQVLAAVSEWTSTTLLSLAVRVSTRGRPYNLVVTNVPGPQIPLYLLRARMRACYPVVNLLPNQGLGVALFSYDGLLFWGCTADWDQLPDLHEFVGAIEESLAELEAVLPGSRKARAGGARGRLSAGNAQTAQAERSSSM